MDDVELAEFVKLALSIEVAQCKILGRKIVLQERHWAVTAGFRFRYPGLTPGEANDLAEKVLEVIDATRQQEEERSK